jgi:hypothetical protein
MDKVTCVLVGNYFYLKKSSFAFRLTEKYDLQYSNLKQSKYNG